MKHEIFEAFSRWLRYFIRIKSEMKQLEEQMDMSIVKGRIHKTVNYKIMDLHKTVVLAKRKSRKLDHEVTKCM